MLGERVDGVYVFINQHVFNHCKRIKCSTTVSEYKLDLYRTVIPQAWTGMKRRLSLKYASKCPIVNTTSIQHVRIQNVIQEQPRMGSYNRLLHSIQNVRKYFFLRFVSWNQWILWEFFIYFNELIDTQSGAYNRTSISFEWLTPSIWTCMWR